MLTRYLLTKEGKSLTQEKELETKQQVEWDVMRFCLRKEKEREQIEEGCRKVWILISSALVEKDSTTYRHGSSRSAWLALLIADTQ